MPRPRKEVVVVMSFRLKTMTCPHGSRHHANYLRASRGFKPRCKQRQIFIRILALPTVTDKGGWFGLLFYTPVQEALQNAQSIDIEQPRLLDDLLDAALKGGVILTRDASLLQGSAQFTTVPWPGLGSAQAAFGLPRTLTHPLPI